MANNIDTEEYMLNKTLEAAAGVKPYVSLAEINALVQQAPVQKPVWYKYFLLAAGIIIIPAAVYWYTDKTIPAKHTAEAINQVNPAQVIPESTSEKPADFSSVERQQVLNAQVNDKPAAKNQTLKKDNLPLLFFPAAYSPLAVPVTNDNGSSELILSLEELNRLHIYTDFHELKFVSLKDSSLTDRKKLQKSGEHLYFYKWVQANGGGYTGINRANYTDSVKQHLDSVTLDVCPVIIDEIVTAVEKENSTEKPGDKKSYIIEPRVLELTTSFEAAVKPMLVPVKVSLQAVPNVFGKTDHDLIFWYKPTEAFIQCLSADNAQRVRARYSSFSVLAYDSVCKSNMLQYHEIAKAQLIKAKLADTLLQDVLTLSKKQLKAMGFKFERKYVKSYRCQYNETDFELRLNGIYSSRNRRTNKKPAQQKPYALFFCQSMDNLEIIPLDLLPQDKTEKNAQKISEETWAVFESKVNDLVPVKVVVRGNQVWYFWFPSYQVLIKD